MKTLTVNGEQYQAEKIVKTQTDIIGYIGNTKVFTFRGINDFAAFRIEGGDFDLDPEAEKEQRIADLEAAITTILGGDIERCLHGSEISLRE